MFAKKTLLIWLLLATINSECSEGCVRCGPEDKCLTCDLQLSWKLVGDTCQRNVDTKCILNGAQDSCLLCNQNFFYDPTQKKCVRSSRRLSLCLHMQDNVSCDICVKGYYPLNGVCTQIKNPIENCKYNRDEERCLQCEEGYWPSSDFTVCLKTPEEKPLDNCKYYSNVYCDKCVDGTIYNPNSYIYSLFEKSDIQTYENYVQNYQFQYSDNVIDTQCEDIKVEFCKEYKSAVECSVCLDGYYLKNGICIANPFVIIDNCIIYSAYNKCQQCEPEYYPYNGSTECRKADNVIENCQIRSLQKCLQCSDDYYLENDTKCTKQIEIDNCAVYSSTSAQCNQCVEQYRVTTDKLKCLLEIENCKTYASSTKNDTALTCNSCTNGTYLDSNKECVNGSIVNCLDYQSNGQTCQKCYNGYYLSGNQCLAHLDIENCQEYSGTIKDTCIQCQTNNFLFTIEKLCYASFEIANCVEFSDRNTCSKCGEYYYLDGNECKLIPEEENCLEKASANSDCLKCAVGYYINTDATPNACLLNFEQQTSSCLTKSTDNNVDRYMCAVCKGNNFFADLKSLSDQIYEGNVCGKIDRIPENQRIENCAAYVDTGSDTWKCQRCSTGYYLSDQSGNVDQFGDSCSSTCNNTKLVLRANMDIVNDTSIITLEKFNDFIIDACVVYSSPDDQCEYMVPINDAGSSGNNFQFKCGKKKASSNYVQKLNYAAGQESPYGFDNNFDLPARHGYFAPTYTLDDTAINSSYPSTNQDNCQSWKVDTAGNSNKYCDKCIHRYTSKAVLQDSNDAANTSYLECDTLIPDCETDVLGGFAYDFQAYARHNVNPMHLSCHSCSNTSQIPFIHLPLDGDAKWTSQYYEPFRVELSISVPKDAPIKDGLVTQCREPTSEGLHFGQADFTRDFPSNCGMGLYNVSVAKTYKISDAMTDVSVFCLACKPGYRPVYDANGFLTNCQEIDNCQKTTTQSVDKFVNGCAKCELEYNYGFDVTNKRVRFDQCVQQVVENCLVSEGENCIYCKKGYFLENSKTCNKFIVPKCVNYNYVNYDFYNVSNASSNIVQYQTSLAIYLTAKQKGCLQCTSNYYPLYRYPLQMKQCVSSYNLMEQKYTNSIYLIENCALYEGNQLRKCNRCNSLYIPNSDHTKCILQKPYPSCAQVTELTPGIYQCLTCQKDFYLVKNKCIRGVIENCTGYDQNTLPLQCNKCANTYRVARDGLSCIPGNLPYCNIYENTFETICNTCADTEHPLVSVNTTQPTTLKRCFEDLEDFNCIDVNTAKLQQNIYFCNECMQGYYQGDVEVVTPNNMCVSITKIEHCKTYDYETNTRYTSLSHKCTECESGYYVSEYGFSCKVRDPAVEFCYVFENDSLQCKTCQEDYFLSDDKLTCYPNPTGVKNCFAYSNATTCIRCDPDYYLDGNLCLPVDKALKSTGCIHYNEQQLCVECNSNYYLDPTTSKCLDPVASGCLTYTDVNTCATCPQGTVFQEVEKNDVVVKSCILFDLQFCIDIDPETRKCNLCATNYYVLLDGTCELAQQIPNCLYYESETECEQCQKGFYRSADKTECYQTGFDLMNKYKSCSDTVYKEQQHCVACDDGMYFKNGVCTACEVANCLACDPRSPLQCLICQSGYTQKTYLGKCEINLEDNIMLPGEDDGTDGNEQQNSVKIMTILGLLLITLFN